MTNVRIQQDNRAALRGAIDAELVKLLNTSAGNIVGNTQARVRVRTGLLQNETRILSSKKLVRWVGMTGRAFYAPYQEFGTKYVLANPALTTSYNQEAPQFTAGVRSLFQSAKTKN
jgi:hypothetical protein